MLIELLPKGLTWLLSFWLIALFWLVRQRLHRPCPKLDCPMLRIGLRQVSLISLFPFSNALMGARGKLVTAAVAYFAQLLAIALLSWLPIAHFMRHGELHSPALSPALAQGLWLRATAFSGSALGALLLTFVIPGWNMLATLFIPRRARR
jgi:uncharacterized membrane protein